MPELSDIIGINRANSPVNKLLGNQVGAYSMKNTTNYQTSTSLNEGIIEIKITGEVTKASVKNMQNEIFAITKSKTSKAVLIDCRDVKGRFGVVEAYHRVRSYPADRPRMITAVVDTEENRDFQSFHENTATNVGQSMKWFSDIDAARAWLKDRLRKGGSTGYDSGKNARDK